MAPIAQPPALKNGNGDSRPRFESLQAWLKIFGAPEYAIYKKRTMAPHLNYDDWAASDHVLGPYLWHTTLDVWEGDSSSEGDSELEGPNLFSLGSTEPRPRRKAIKNGHGMRQSTKSTASAAREKSEGVGASPKRGRRPKKKFLSEEIVVSDDNDDIEESTPVAQVATAVAPMPTVGSNGRRKSGVRRKKKFLSEETIPPEDLDDDAMSIDDVGPAAPDAAAPTGLGQRQTPNTAANAEPPKPRRGGRPKKKYLSQEIVLPDDDEDSAPAEVATPSTMGASPDDPETSASGRRPLRIRTPAQQRPYFHNARLFEEQVSVEPEVEDDLKPPSAAQINRFVPDTDTQDEEDEMLLNDDFDALFAQSEGPVKKAHYKGKGRAWKKTEEDEDEDYVSPVKVRVPKHPKRHSGRRKSTRPSDASLVEDDPAEETELQQENEIVVLKPKQKAERKKPGPKPKAGKPKPGPKRKHHLSEEFVRDESDTEVEEQPSQIAEQPLSVVLPQTPMQKTPRPRGRPRKSQPQDSSQNTVQHSEGDGSVSLGNSAKAVQKAKSGTAGDSIGLSIDGAGNKSDGGDDSEIYQNWLSPLRQVRKRKSVGSDEE